VVTNYFPRYLAILILVGVSLSFASNHVAARLTFDAGTGLLLAVICRSFASMLILFSLLTITRESLKTPTNLTAWQLLAGILVAVQSLLLYKSISLIPIGITLLISNLYPVFYILLNWLTGGNRPTLRMLFAVIIIISGLLLVLDVIHLLQGKSFSKNWYIGICSSIGASVLFAFALWITNHRLTVINGTVRSFFTVLYVFGFSLLISGFDIIENGLNLPTTNLGVLGLVLLALFYGIGFSVMFIFMPKLNLAKTGPVMNLEPVIALLLGSLVLNQNLTFLQLVGCVIVIGGIIIFSTSK